MFWLDRFTRLLRPIPPTPTAATFSVSLGASNPCPRTCRGMIVSPAPVTATFDTNLRLERLINLLLNFGSQGDTAVRKVESSLTTDDPNDNDYTRTSDRKKRGDHGITSRVSGRSRNSRGRDSAQSAHPRLPGAGNVVIQAFGDHGRDFAGPRPRLRDRVEGVRPRA